MSGPALVTRTRLALASLMPDRKFLLNQMTERTTKDADALGAEPQPRYEYANYAANPSAHFLHTGKSLAHNSPVTPTGPFACAKVNLDRILR
jgi:hypothetical protein